MEILTFTSGLAGAKMLHLSSLRLVRAGIERAHDAPFQRLLRIQIGYFGSAFNRLSLAVSDFGDFRPVRTHLSIPSEVCPAVPAAGHLCTMSMRSTAVTAVFGAYEYPVKISPDRIAFRQSRPRGVASPPRNVL